MSEPAAPVCFHCGLATESDEDGPKLNRLPDGQPCPACAERLLASLPSLVREVAGEIERVVREESGDDYFPDEPA
ncbi:MAG TPA: hypothetical protein VMT18_16365 [Planctomycetota bacterium]|nr:hypothetical protein [Planctomycetota bacterium]